MAFKRLAEERRKGDHSRLGYKKKEKGFQDFLRAIFYK
jgi:hypothetical protein